MKICNYKPASGDIKVSIPNHKVTNGLEAEALMCSTYIEQLMHDWSRWTSGWHTRTHTTICITNAEPTYIKIKHNRQILHNGTVHYYFSVPTEGGDQWLDQLEPDNIFIISPDMNTSILTMSHPSDGKFMYSINMNTIKGIEWVRPDERTDDYKQLIMIDYEAEGYVHRLFIMIYNSDLFAWLSHFDKLPVIKEFLLTNLI